jgi:hypothetical protein
MFIKRKHVDVHSGEKYSVRFKVSVYLAILCMTPRIEVLISSHEICFLELASLFYDFWNEHRRPQLRCCGTPRKSRPTALAPVRHRG